MYTYVIECDNGWFGYNCLSQCHCKGQMESCNKTTGYCESGCDIGWSGQNCSYGKYKQNVYAFANL